MNSLDGGNELIAISLLLIEMIDEEMTEFSISLELVNSSDELELMDEVNVSLDERTISLIGSDESKCEVELDKLILLGKGNSQETSNKLKKMVLIVNACLLVLFIMITESLETLKSES